MATILTSFLDANLLPIGDDDEKFQFLESAANDLAKQISATPLLAYRLTLVGLDERVPVTDPAHKLVEGVVMDKWQTMKNKTGAGPVQIYRAVMLRALEIAATDNTALRFAVTLIVRNQPERASADCAKPGIATMVTAFEDAAAKELADAWVNPVDMALLKLHTEIQKPQIKKEDLATLNADTVAAAIQAGAKLCAQDMQEALREIVQQWATGLERLAGRDAKAELLWIRASQYSPSARSGLRDLAPSDLVFHTVLDVGRAVPAMSPPSVEHFLKELVTSINPNRTRLVDLLTAVSTKFAGQPEAKAILANTTLAPDGRCGWLERAARGGAATSFEEQTGVSPDYDDTFGELAVKLYRELQIRKLLASAK
jgi:hypothetical protein